MKYDWSDLDKLYLEEGLSPPEIAQIKGCDSSAVCHALRRHQIPRQRDCPDPKPLECFSCGIGIGPGHEESIPSHAGSKILCGWCYGKLKKQGYIQLNHFTRLLPGGAVIRFTQSWIR